MKAQDVKTMDDVVKYIKARGSKQGYSVLEVKQKENRLFITYGKIQKPNERELAPGHKLILSTQINATPKIKHIYTKLNLCKFIEPYKSQRGEYEKKRTAMIEGKEVTTI